MTPPTFLVRPAVADDLPALVGLLQQLFSLEADFVPDAAKQRRGLELLLQRPQQAVVLVALRNGEVVGMCSAQLLVSTAQGGEVALVEDVVVDAGRRGDGTGTALLEALQRWAQGRGLSRLQLLADRGNTPALDFYYRRGWSPTQLSAWRRFLPEPE